jgi:hypothetical protein
LAKVLDLCTKQVVSARACVNQFLPYSLSGIALFGMRTVQADSCLNSDRIDTLFISVRGQEGALGGGCHFRSDVQNLHVTVRKNNFVSWVTRTKFTDYENIFAQRPKSFPSSHTQIEHAIPFHVYQGFALAPQM